MNNVVKKLIPKQVRSEINKLLLKFRLCANYYYDMRQYAKYSATLNEISRQKLESRVVETYHVLEKGLAMRDARPGFGEDKCKLLILLVRRYLEEFGSHSSQVYVACNVIERYMDFNKNNGVCQDKIFSDYEKILNIIESSKRKILSGGVVELKKDDLLKAAGGPFNEFCMSRRSIRDYTDEPVDLNLVRSSINFAQFSPSVCNRQSVRVIVLSDKKLIKKALSHQNGNRGFGHLAGALLIVLSDLECFKGVNERNQAHIDAGMFAMTLLYSLHYNNLGACPLNWSVPKERDRSLKRDLGIEDRYFVAMMICVGNIPSTLKVAESFRDPVENVVIELH